MIRNVGLINLQSPGFKSKYGDNKLQEAIKLGFEIYLNPKHPNHDRQATSFLSNYSYPLRLVGTDTDDDDTKQQRVEIHFMGVWDTVSALEGPSHGIHDARLSKIVRFARHALAVNERRKNFRPEIWVPDSQKTDSQQRWFPGVHSDVGGGYKDNDSLANGALVWMAKEAHFAAGLPIIDSELKKKEQEDKPKDGRLHNSLDEGMGGTFIKWRTLGSKKRKICQTSLDEDLHPNTRIRYTEDKKYRPSNLVAFFKSETVILKRSGSQPIIPVTDFPLDISSSDSESERKIP